jgi:hypothetical protein
MSRARRNNPLIGDWMTAVVELMDLMTTTTTTPPL